MSEQASPTPGSSLLGAGQIRELAGRLGVRPTKHWGQNFVIDANTVRRIVRLADVRPDDVVVEIGPGLGSLTLALLPQVARVVAVEIDTTLAAASLVFGFFPRVIDWLGEALGVAYPPVLALVGGIAVLLVKVLLQDLENTRQERQIRRLAQRLAIYEADKAPPESK